MATVTVGCKLLHGVKLRLSDGTDVMLRGARQAPGFDMRTGEGAPGSVGLTEIDASVWAQIQKEYARWPMLTGGMVFADAKKSKVIDQAKEKAEQKTGLEPISDKELAADKVERIDPPKGQ
ncbi:hypothetical protein [Acetobacter pasteurianus]|nr:hypothetical protein [Acetobacter pasteurianus]